MHAHIPQAAASLLISGFDAYRDPEARKLMVEYVMRFRTIDAGRAVAALRELNHIGLANCYSDARHWLWNETMAVAEKYDTSAWGSRQW